MQERHAEATETSRLYRSQYRMVKGFLKYDPALVLRRSWLGRGYQSRDVYIRIIIQRLEALREGIPLSVDFQHVFGTCALEGDKSNQDAARSKICVRLCVV